MAADLHHVRQDLHSLWNILKEQPFDSVAWKCGNLARLALDDLDAIMRAPPLAAPAPSAMATGERYAPTMDGDMERHPDGEWVRATPPAAPAAVTEAIQRADQYLQAGGLFNPEMMEHEKVRDLIVAMRAALAAAASAERGA